MKLIFKCLILALFLVSCSSSTKLNQSDVRPEEIYDLQRFETISEIYLINHNESNPIHSDSLSKKSKAIFLKALKSFSNQIPNQSDINIFDQKIRVIIENEISKMFKKADEQQSISGLSIPPYIDSILEAKSKRFALLTFTSGTIKAKEKKSNIKQSENISIGTISNNDNAYQIHSIIAVIIVDSKENNIAFYKKSLLENEEPLDLSILKKQIDEIFSGYFW